MKLPIYAYGQPVLRQKADPISNVTEEIETLIKDMWETMYDAHGVGLAAPQIGKAIRLFVIDTQQLEKPEKAHKGFKKVFINAQLLDESGELWGYEEGCLSIPEIRAEIERMPTIRIRYQDETGKEFDESYDGINARVIQHEYDHIEGVLFLDRMKPLKRKMLNKRLEKIRKGEIPLEYAMKFNRN